jgi:hypothetical protein
MITVRLLREYQMSIRKEVELESLGELIISDSEP